MNIRQALPSDANGIEALFLEFVAYLRSIGDVNEYRFSAEKYLADGFGPDPAFRGFVAEDQSRLIGYVLFCKAYDGDYERFFYVVDLYVQTEWRQKGIGRQLMDAAADAARREGVRRLSWLVHKNNTDAIRFYQRLGAVAARDHELMYLEL